MIQNLYVVLQSSIVAPCALNAFIQSIQRAVYTLKLPICDSSGPPSLAIQSLTLSNFEYTPNYKEEDESQQEEEEEQEKLITT